MVLVPLFMLSRENDKEKAEKTKEEVIIDEEPVIMEVPDIVENILYESASKFRMHMKSLEEYDDALAVSIESQNWDDISKYAMLLKNTSPLIFTDKRKVELPKEFIMLDTFFHFQSLAVVEASKSREMVRLNIEYEKLQQTCNDCHEKYKKKE
ncbi:MAG: hypothetical protein A2Y08_03040 [Planctomycetes bacterium GWA2_40_7]|nr:MAG: hypothetical protein A2Y08_03040 [Planctomycetes bacterium GWA2_40_7]OHB49257.1 MAG: hypothetical protein A2106_03015 [Planctomycetes bacterium GWF2_40_8]